jgi:tetratricopeptide (TPR) repeat protein
MVAEECLARAQPEKAAELAHRALDMRPDSLEAKAVADRARRQLARQRRQGRQEQRLQEASALLDAGDVAGADTLVGSVLKRMPGHPGALALFGRLKGRRGAKGDAEAEAEQELARMAQGQVRRAAEAARKARAGGWDRKAMLALRRGLLLVPDDAELLELLHQTQQSLGEQDRSTARQRAGNVQVRQALDWLRDGRLDDSLKSLRSLLRQDPDNARAQAAIQEVRRVWLARAGPVPSPAPPSVAPAAVPSPAPRAAAPVAPSPPAPAPVVEVPRPAAPPPAAAPPTKAVPAVAPPTSPPPPAAAPVPRATVVARPRPAAAPPAPAARVPASAPVPPRPPEAVRRPAASPAAPPPEIVLRPTRKGTPLLIVLGSAALVIGLLVVLTTRPSGGRPSPPALPSAPPPPAAATAPPATPPPAGPLATADPDVREAVEATLTSYARALETQDEALLARVRPDLTAAERERLLAPFRGAVNVATDLRVLDVIPGKGVVVVPVLRTDVIVGGRGRPTAPVEETLRFERRDGTWRLAAGPR